MSSTQLVVAPDVDHDHGRRLWQQADVAPNRDLVAGEPGDAGSQLAPAPSVNWRATPSEASPESTTTGTSRSHRRGPPDRSSAVAVDIVERRLHVAELGRQVAGHRSVADLVADPIGRRAQLVQEIALHRRLQVGVTVEPELAGESYDRGRSRTRTPSEVGDRAEAHRLRPGEDHLGHSPLGGRQFVAGCPDPLGDLHRGATVARCRRSTGSGGAGHTGGVDSATGPDAVRSRATTSPAPIRACSTPSPRANVGHVMAYGGDAHTAECEAAISASLFGPTTRDVSRVHGHGRQRARPGDDVETGAGDRVHELVAHRRRRDRRPRADPRRQVDRLAERRRQDPSRSSSTSSPT